MMPVWLRLMWDAASGQAGWAKLNGEKVDNAELEVAPVGEVIVQAGKRRFARIIFT